MDYTFVLDLQLFLIIRIMIYINSIAIFASINPKNHSGEFNIKNINIINPNTKLNAAAPQTNTDRQMH